MNDSLTLADKAVINQSKVLCADKYGDAIYMARMMARTYEDVDYEVYDGCLQDPAPRTQEKEKYRIDQIRIYPNPSESIVNIEFADLFTGDIKVTNNTGHIIYNSKCINESIHSIDLSKSSGFYVIHVRNINGTSNITKVIITK